jgi:hypothetical protein
MRPSRISFALFFFFATLYSCKKDNVPTIATQPTPVHIYHVSYFDHKSGEKITGLEAELLSIHNFEGFIVGGGTIKTDANGVFNFNAYWDYNFYSYLKLSTQTYVEALYELNEFLDTTRQYTHTKEGSNGPNVVYARLLRKDGRDFYFTADLYRKAPVDIHIVQVSDYSDTLNAIFNASITGSDPSNVANIFGVNDLLGEGIKLHPDKKIDTTIRVYGFGDYLNKVSWSVYGIVEYGLDDFSRKNFSEGYLDDKKYPSDIPSNITITF